VPVCFFVRNGETSLFYASNAGFNDAAKLIQEAIDKHKKKDLIVHRDVKLGTSRSFFLSLNIHSLIFLSFFLSFFSTDNYPAIVDLMKNSDTGVQLKDRTAFFITYRCFLGTELIDWILKVFFYKFLLLFVLISLFLSLSLSSTVSSHSNSRRSCCLLSTIDGRSFHCANE
jgi:hypothetical protein